MATTIMQEPSPESSSCARKREDRHKDQEGLKEQIDMLASKVDSLSIQLNGDKPKNERTGGLYTCKTTSNRASSGKSPASGAKIEGPPRSDRRLYFSRMILRTRACSPTVKRYRYIPEATDRP